jgi:hypothetical protein
MGDMPEGDMPMGDMPMAYGRYAHGSMPMASDVFGDYRDVGPDTRRLTLLGTFRLISR